MEAALEMFVIVGLAQKKSFEDIQLEAIRSGNNILFNHLLQHQKYYHSFSEELINIKYKLQYLKKPPESMISEISSADSSYISNDIMTMKIKSDNRYHRFDPSETSSLNSNQKPKKNNSIASKTSVPDCIEDAVTEKKVHFTRKRTHYPFKLKEREPKIHIKVCPNITEISKIKTDPHNSNVTYHRKKLVVEECNMDTVPEYVDVDYYNSISCKNSRKTKIIEHKNKIQDSISRKHPRNEFFIYREMMYAKVKKVYGSLGSSIISEIIIAGWRNLPKCDKEDFKLLARIERDDFKRESERLQK